MGNTLCDEVWRLRMETNFPKKYLCSWVTGPFGVPEEKFTVQNSGRKCVPLMPPWMLMASRTLAWTDGWQGSPRGRAAISSLQLCKCPTAPPSQSNGSEQTPSKCQRDDSQDTSNVWFSFGSKPESFEPET